MVGGFGVCVDGLDLIEVFVYVFLIVIVFLFDGVDELNFDVEIIVLIFVGKIVKWNDLVIVKDNFDVMLLDFVIMLVYCLDKFGIIGNFIDYLL